MFFRSLNIGLKLVLSVAIAIIIGMIILVSIVSVEVASNMEKEAKDSIFLTSKRYVNYMEGILNESVVLTKGIAASLNAMFKQNDQVDIDVIESLMKNTFDSSGYAAYTFLYLEDPSVLSKTHTLDSHFTSDNGNTFAMIFFDETTGKAGGIKTIKTPNSFSNLAIIKEIKQKARYGDKDTLFVGPPTKLNYNGTEFLGINFGMPIFSKSGKFVGVMGYTLDFLEVSQTILDPKLDFYEGDLRFLMSDSGVIVIHKNKNAILKTLPDINKDPSANLVVEAVKAHKDTILDNYIASTGDPSYASVTTFTTMGDSSRWSMVVTAPKKSVLAPLYKLQFVLIGITILILIAILVVVYFCVRKIVGARIPIILKSLENFFRFLNYEKIEVKPIVISSNDELGKMGAMINENILQTKQGLEQDNQAVKESVGTVQVVKKEI